MSLRKDWGNQMRRSSRFHAASNLLDSSNKVWIENPRLNFLFAYVHLFGLLPLSSHFLFVFHSPTPTKQLLCSNLSPSISTLLLRSGRPELLLIKIYVRTTACAFELARRVTSWNEIFVIFMIDRYILSPFLYFPLTKHHARMYACYVIAKILTWI